MKIHFVSKKQVLMSIALILWVGSLVGGFRYLILYQMTPGPAGPFSQSWPESSSLSRSGKGSTLVLFAHPRCPCTKATCENLALIMAQAKDRLSAHVVMLKPDATDNSWIETELYRKFKSIPGVKIYKDTAGIEIQRFQAHTSGEVVVYDHQGQLRFRGGITMGRGHSGDNEGRDAVIDLLHGKKAKKSTPVFGCALSSSQLEPLAGIKL